MHNNNNNRRNNHNNRRFKNNNQNKRRFGPSSGSSFDDESSNLSIQQRKNFANKQEQYLQKAKDSLRNGDRIEAENYYQHADHCYRMMNLGLSSGSKFDPVRGQIHNPNYNNNYNNSENGDSQQNMEVAQNEGDNNSQANDIGSLPFLREPIAAVNEDPRIIE